MKRPWCLAINRYTTRGPIKEESCDGLRDVVLLLREHELQQFDELTYVPRIAVKELITQLVEYGGEVGACR